MSRAIDIMTENPVSISIAASVGDAIQVLQNLEVRHVPVIDESQKLVGMISDRDVRAIAIPHTIDEQWLGDFRVALETEITRVMSSNVIAIEEEAETSEIIELMLEHKVGALPVTDDEGTLVGIVSYVDVLRELYELETT
ncbi:MAG TPA: CBS domain-containing protein [Polyangiales bacterium]|nr:CBS domain-containing protein [Polyangiales bacterium]